MAVSSDDKTLQKITCENLGFSLVFTNGGGGGGGGCGCAGGRWIRFSNIGSS